LLQLRSCVCTLRAHSHILKQAYAAKDGETKRLTARITELEAALSEQKELNRSLVRA